MDFNEELNIISHSVDKLNHLGKAFHITGNARMCEKLQDIANDLVDAMIRINDKRSKAITDNYNEERGQHAELWAIVLERAKELNNE